MKLFLSYTKSNIAVCFVALSGLFLLSSAAAAQDISLHTLSVAVQEEESPQTMFMEEFPVEDAPSVEDAADALAVIVEDVTGHNVPAPEDQDLKPDSGEDALDSMLNEPDDSVTISGPATEGAEQFFDADSLVPQGEMAKSGPRKVNPSLQPASKLVIVRNNYAANSYNARLVSAERAIMLGRYDSAVMILDDLRRKNAHDPRVLMQRAVALQKLGRFDEAMQAYEETAKVDPKNVEVQVNMLGLLGAKYPSIALRRLMDLRTQNQDHVGIVAQIAVLQAQLGDFQGGLQYLGLAASMEPSNASHVFNMAVIADRAGDSARAVSYYEKALELDTIYGGSKSIPRDSIYERLAQIR